jgi:hypothetical protein
MQLTDGQMIAAGVLTRDVEIREGEYEGRDGKTLSYRFATVNLVIGGNGTRCWLDATAGGELIPLVAGKTKGEFLRAVVQPVSKQTAKGWKTNWRIVRVIPTDEQLSLETQEAAA